MSHQGEFPLSNEESTATSAALQTSPESSAGKRAPKYSGLLLWSGVTAVILASVLLYLVLRRPAYEQAYIDQLYSVRNTAEWAARRWHNIQLAYEFPNGPHFQNMNADQALRELNNIRLNISDYNSTMKSLTEKLTELDSLGGELVAKRPELEPLHSQIVGPDMLRPWREGEIPYKLTALQFSVRTMLETLGEKPTGDIYSIP